MACELIPGAVGPSFLCGDFAEEPAPPCACGVPSTRLCDGPKDSGTCDAPLCDGCAREVARWPAMPADDLVRAAIRSRYLRHVGDGPAMRERTNERVRAFVEDETFDLCPTCAQARPPMPTPEEMRARMAGQTDWGTHGSADLHRRYVEPVPKVTRRRRACGLRATHAGRANGVTLINGCELCARRWVRDGR